MYTYYKICYKKDNRYWSSNLYRDKCLDLVVEYVEGKEVIAANILPKSLLFVCPTLEYAVSDGIQCINPSLKDLCNFSVFEALSAYPLHRIPFYDAIITKTKIWDTYIPYFEPRYVYELFGVPSLVVGKKVYDFIDNESIL